MIKNVFRLLFVPVWIAGLWGSLQIHTQDLNLGHRICGAWGCGPPIEALIGYHSFWLLLILPIAIGLGLYLPSGVSRKVGLAVVLIAMCGTLAFVGWDVATYRMKAESSQYLLQRAFFSLVTSVDLPMTQTLGAGLILAFWFGRRQSLPDAWVDGNDVGNPFAATAKPQCVGE